MNIFLIGFMGCGKSTLGKKLAKKMSYSFIDLDKEIEISKNESIQDIFDKDGESFFRDFETSWLNNYKGNYSIISLGGGTPCFNKNMELINSIGTSIYLKMKSSSLTTRLHNSKQKRPIIEKYKDDKIKLEENIIEMLSIREPYYNQANLTFKGSYMTDSKIELIINAINGNV
jgi:shikimate kinase